MLVTDVKLFAGAQSKYLAENIADFYGQPLGNMKTPRFSDGEFQPVINEAPFFAVDALAAGLVDGQSGPVPD